MSLNLEWRHRIDNWRKVLPMQFYTPLGSVEWSGFVTDCELSLAEAAGARPVAPARRHPLGSQVGVRLVQRAASPPLRRQRANGSCSL